MRLCFWLAAIVAGACSGGVDTIRHDGGGPKEDALRPTDVVTDGMEMDIPKDRPAPTTCESGQFWTDGTRGDPLMSPGRPCRACHILLAPEHAYFFQGTVYGALHERDDCESPPPPDARIEIVDADGNVRLTLLPNAVGNFQSASVESGVPLPYFARVVANGQVRTMKTAQRNGDCNTCHTEQGDEGALGRIVWPSAIVDDGLE